jgi:hypothetical protein
LDASGSQGGGGEASSDEAVWRDLIARYDMAVDLDTAAPPWPDIESLGTRPPGPPAWDQVQADQAQADQAQAGQAQHDQVPRGPGRSGPASLDGAAYAVGLPAALPPGHDAEPSGPGPGSGDGPAGPDAGPDAGPAGPDAGPAGPDAGPAGPDAGPAGPDAGLAGADAGAARSSSEPGTGPGSGRGGPGSERGAPGTERGAPGSERDGPASGSRGGPGTGSGADRTRVIRHATARGPRSPAEDENRDEDEHYVPPPPPPLPHLDPVAKGAWTALFGGPAYLLVASIAGWVVPGWAALGAVAAFIGGFTAVVLRLGDRSAGDDDPDQGAVL